MLLLFKDNQFMTSPEKTVLIIEDEADAADVAVQVDEAGLSEVERSACPTCGSCSGMFTANSMNCLTEAIGLALPGNGSVLATHAFRKELFLQAGRTIVAAPTVSATRVADDVVVEVRGRAVAAVSANRFCLELLDSLGPMMIMLPRTRLGAEYSITASARPTASAVRRRARCRREGR